MTAYTTPLDLPSTRLRVDERAHTDHPNNRPDRRSLGRRAMASDDTTTNLTLMLADAAKRGALRACPASLNRRSRVQA